MKIASCKLRLSKGGALSYLTVRCAITFLHERKMGAQVIFVRDNKRITKAGVLHKKNGKL